jgi:hypothetical protein
MFIADLEKTINIWWGLMEIRPLGHNDPPNIN